MNIEIVPKAGCRDKLTILVNKEAWKEIHTAIFGRTPRFPVCHDEKEWVSKFEVLEFQKVRNYVIRRLSMQSYHSKEMAQLLKKRLVNRSTIKKIVEEFIEKGFFNDQLWVESFIRTHRKRLALPLILQKMRLKGLSDRELDQIKATWQDDNQEKLSIEHLLNTRYRLKDFTELATKQKVIRSLIRKGFSFEIIKKVLDELINKTHF